MKKRVSSKRFVPLGAAILLLVLIVWTVWGNRALTVNTITVSGSRIPDAFSGFRIAQISDLHNAEFGKNNAELLNLLSESGPDIIVITGDLIDASHTDVKIALSFTQESVKIAPTYYVTGNHEAASSQYAALKTGMKEAGVIVLEDERVSFGKEGETIELLGLADPDFSGADDLFGDPPVMVRTKLSSMMVEENSYTVLLSHRPELFEAYVDCGVDLVLSGHAHGGQFRLPFVGGLIAPNQGLFPIYDAGLYTNDSTNMVVSRGIGNSMIPIRFNNRPEIVLVELMPER